MTPRRAGELALTLFVGLLVISLFAGQLLGQPILLGFVETGSMAPSLQPGDGFIAIPADIAGSIEPGDVIVFRAEVIDGGGLTTHRVVAETEEGFITRGDANVVTDQDSGEPPVQRAQIVAEVLQIGGYVVTIPSLGVLVLGIQGVLAAVQRTIAQFVGSTALLGTQGLAYLIFAFGVLAYALTIIEEYLAEEGKDRSRRRRSSRDDESLDAGLTVLALTLLLVAIVTGSMVGPGGTQTFNVVSADTDSERQYVIKRGSSEQVQYTVPSTGILPTSVFFEPNSPRITVDPVEVYVPGGQSANVTITLTAPPQTGHYPQYLTEHRYIAILPQSTIRFLYQIHPWLPIIAIDAFVGVGFAGIGWALIGTGRIRVRSRTADLTWEERIRRLFR